MKIDSFTKLIAILKDNKFPNPIMAANLANIMNLQALDKLILIPNGIINLNPLMIPGINDIFHISAIVEIKYYDDILMIFSNTLDQFF